MLVVRGTMAEEDIKREKPTIERKHEWAHGDGGLGKNCIRSGRPVFTNPASTPRECKGPTCQNDEWVSKGYVLRDAKSKQVVHREASG